MFNINNRTFFNKITEVISGRALDKLIEKYNSNYRTQHFDTSSHLLSMLYFQLKGLSSLRELQTSISNNKKLMRMINIPSTSQLSRKNESRDYRIFEELYYHVVEKAMKMVGRQRLNIELPVIKIIDSTMIDLPFTFAKQYRYDDKQKRSAVKISTLFNGDFPEKVQIVSGKVNDRKCIEGFIEDKEIIYVFDRGYNDYKWFDNLSDNTYRFITRQLSNTCVEEIRSSYVKTDNVYDYEITMGAESSRNKTKNSYREILTFDENEEEFRLVTNIFDIPAEGILALYKKRWDIELFFKWIKQNLKIKKCIGYSENAIKIQIYTALIMYMLLYILKAKSNSKLSILMIMRIAKSNILEDFDDCIGYLLTG